MGQDNLFEKLYGEPEPRPEEDKKVTPHLKSRSGRAFLETLKNGAQPGDLCTTDTGSKPD